MTDKKSRRVVIINNVDSANIDQAIFILKSDPCAPRKNISAGIAKEAQAIIDSYVRQVERIKDGYPPCTAAKAHKKIPMPLVLTLVALGILCIGLSLTVFRLLG